MNVGQLGKLLFQSLEAPASISQKWANNYTEHDILNRLSEIESTGEKRSRVSLAFQFRELISCANTQVRQQRAPKELLQELLSMMQSKQAYSLFIGTEYMGRFKIAEMMSDYIGFNAQSEPNRINVNVELIEVKRSRKGQVGNEI